MTWDTDCPIWGEGHKATIYGYGRNAERGNFIIDESRIFSPRTDGEYRLSEEAYEFIISRRTLSDKVKAKLTTWLVDQRRLGVVYPVITYEIAHSFVETDSIHALPVARRAERLLRLLVHESKEIGYTVVIHDCFERAMAWSESTSHDQVLFLLQYLQNQELIENYDHRVTGSGRCLATVSVKGFEFLEEIVVNPDSSQAFVAMWFDDEMNEAYDKGIKPAIERAGYRPLRIDLKDDVIKIDDEIFAEIRRSRFLVADMTQGDDGARGGVYYEAGLASGLGLPVIYTCFHEKKNLLSFDTRQFFHIFWVSPKDLREQLHLRILARIGRGPE